MRQPVDRDHQNVILDALDSPRANKTHDPQGAVACPSSPAPEQPRRLLAHSSEMAPVVGSGLRLDRDRNPGRRDRHRVDISRSLPPKRVPQSPALGAERHECTLHVVLRAGTDATTTGECEPVASADTEHHGDDQEQRAGHASTDGHDAHSEDGRRRARQGQSSGPHRPSVLLAARVVRHAAPPRSEELEPITRRSSYHRRTGSQRRRTRLGVLNVRNVRRPATVRAYVAHPRKPLFAAESAVIFGPHSPLFAPHTAGFGANRMSGDGGY